MESYSTLLADMLAPEYNAMVVDKTTENVMNHMPDKTVRVIIGILDGCPTPHELKESLMKRLKGSKDCPGCPDLCIVAVLCLASEDYSVSHESLCSVTKRSMLKIWSNLERLTVSSSYQLRQWMRSHIGTRTCEGYMAKWNIMRDFGHTIGNSKVELSHWLRNVDVTKEMAYKISGQPTTITDALRDDMTVSGKIGIFIDQ
jgi:hypothetical protein